MIDVKIMCTTGMYIRAFETEIITYKAIPLTNTWQKIFMP